MAIHDIDKTNDDRSEPLPNRHDTKNIDERMAHQTASSHYNPVGPNAVGRLYQIGKSFFANDGTNDRAIFGLNSTTNTWGVFASKPGQDIKTTDPSKYAFSSDYDSFKIAQSGTINITVSSLTKSAVGVYQNSGSAQAAHNLGFIPAFVVFWSDNTNYLLPSVSVSSVSTSSGAYFGQTVLQATADSSNIYFTALQQLWILTAGSITLPGNTYPIKYYLLQETAN